ncbi:nuclease-related domain-containing protein [Paucisalibacillus globulus]|uniref:nuclease-related domain-containing protein n=1 Tax=Paucisalibacillus globulus TaxID=351095 RepID=UPI0004229314|nr:nuclease-related domain-containing protein [Paucisalibacillus globulus]
MHQIKLFRVKPYNILCYEALFRWLKPQYRNNQILLNDYSNYLAGYRGEKNADYTVSIYPHNNASIFQGIRLKVGPFHFQTDTLIVTNMFILILEIKNLAKEVEYDSDSHQLTQSDGTKKKGYKSPILQAATQKLQLTTWLQKHRFPPIPIETLSILSNPSTILSFKGDLDVSDKFIHLETLPSILDRMYSRYSQTVINRETINKLNRLLLKENTPHKPDLLKQYDISDDFLIDGIGCEHCEHYPMIYKMQTWYCSNCGQTEKNAHERKILDYFLLKSPTITNKECRNLIKIDSHKIVYRMLQSMPLKQTGKNSARKYHAPKLPDFPQNSSTPIKKKSVFS